MQLPDDFIQLIRPVFGEERFGRFLLALEEEPPVSIRVNPLKTENSELRTERHDDTSSGIVDGKTNHTSQFSVLNSQFEAVPWCRHGYYLPTRPNFTFDPLLHAGCYYVQEASSMFLDEVLLQHLTTTARHSAPITALDLCAAPGGKSTLLRSALPENSILYSNEPNRKRAGILLENVTKWGYDNHYVTCLYPRDYRRSGMKFDLILCDVPCSGEGMFRKDHDAVNEWSLKNVMRCQELQREIVSDAWECLNEGGLIIYSTCTFNILEDEENVRWMADNLGAELLQVETEPEWGITGSLLESFVGPVYRFIPGYTRGEGLFMAVMRKPLSQPFSQGEMSSYSDHQGKQNSDKQGKQNSSKQNHQKKKNRFNSSLNILTPPLSLEERSGKRFPLSYPQAIAYLRGEAIVLPAEAPRGLVEVTFNGHPIGLVKNIGTRANNLYPKEWRIKSTHVPQEYHGIF